MKIVVTEFVSLDGVIEEPRWTFEFDRGDDGDQFKLDELFDADALLLGRVTYEGFAAAWPNMNSDDFGRRMNGIPKYVVSSTLKTADANWGETTVLRGDVVDEVRALKALPGGYLLVEGSAQLVQCLVQHGLVDEFRLMVFPIVLGQGKRLFPTTMPQATKMALLDCRTTGSGVLLVRYGQSSEEDSAHQQDSVADSA
jgi:dihydrofolate reductase